MMQTALYLAILPMLAGFIAFITAALLAAYRVAALESAPFAPDYTDGVEWASDLSLELDVDAEWVALADAPVVSVSRATALAFRAERAAIDSWIDAIDSDNDVVTALEIVETQVPVRTVRTAVLAIVDAILATVGTPSNWPLPEARKAAGLQLSAARKRIVARVTHTTEANTTSFETLVSDCNLISSGRASFLISARQGIAQAQARRTLTASLNLAFNREWCEAFAAPSAPVAECPENAAAAAYEGLGTLAILAHARGDEEEISAVLAVDTTSHLESLAA